MSVSETAADTDVEVDVILSRRADSASGCENEANKLMLVSTTVEVPEASREDSNSGTFAISSLVWSQSEGRGSS